MRKFLIIGLALFFVICIGISRASAVEISLFDWVFNVNNEDIHEKFENDPDPPDPLPDYFDDALFDWTTGLGTITINYNPGSPGDYFFIGFFDHEIDEPINTFFNEYGTSHETLADGQSWEIDEPGYLFGDIYFNVLAGELDNSNGVPPGFEDDVSMALGWDFTLAAGETAMIQLILAEEEPTIPHLYLSHTDPDSLNYSIYYSSILAIEGGPVTIPEPGTMILLGSLFLGLIGLQIRRI